MGCHHGAGVATTKAHGPPGASGDKPSGPGVAGFFGVFRFSRRAVALVWRTSRPLTILLASLTLIAGLLPAAVAYVGKNIVDAVVLAADAHEASGQVAFDEAVRWVVIEAGLVAAMAAAQRGISVCQSLLRAMLGHRVNVMILDKARRMSLEQFEDAEFYDRLTRARREASSRPLSLVNRTFGLVQNAISLTSYGVLLVEFSPWALVILVAAGVPAFVAEAKFSGDAFRLFRWRSPDTRRQMYLETVLAREDYAKEVKLMGLGPRLLQQYREIFVKLFSEDRALTLRRGAWGFGLGLLSTGAFYGAYGWIAYATIAGQITLGAMTMYLLLFKQGQSAVTSSLSAIGGMYEDNLYLSNLYEFLEQPTELPGGTKTEGPAPHDGVRFEDVGFTYPGADEPALQGVTVHLRPGQALALVGENGSGKTTMIKLLTRLYAPTSGRVTLDGLDLSEWEPTALRHRIGVIFQDFARYQMLVGENIGAGDAEAWDDESRWAMAAEAGMAAPFIESMPDTYRTQLGRWFAGGRELSGGQWQKIALSRAFMRRGADILVLDEPTAAMDAEAEAQVFSHVRRLAADKITVLISHRFSTVRMADHIVVLDQGRVVEQGSHTELLQAGNRYATLFELQAAGYR